MQQSYCLCGLLQCHRTENLAKVNQHAITAKIYIPVPSAGEGKGKVQVSLQGLIMEYEAITDDDEKLSMGENVIVEAVVGSDIVKVMRA